MIYDQDNLNTLLQTLDTFQICSGLKINYEKTELLRIVSLKNSNARLYTQKQLQWTNNVVKLLGVQLTADRKQLLKLNYEPIITNYKISLVFGNKEKSLCLVKSQSYNHCWYLN